MILLIISGIISFSLARQVAFGCRRRKLYFGATPNDLTCTAYFAYSTQLFVKIAEILGRTEDVKAYSELHKKIVEKFQKTFFDRNGVMTAQTQAAHIVALYFGLVPEKYKKKQ